MTRLKDDLLNSLRERFDVYHTTPREFDLLDTIDALKTEIKAAETAMFDRFWDIAASSYGVESGRYTPASLLAAVAKKAKEL